VLLAVLILLAAVAVAILSIGWRGLPRATVRMSHARVPTPDEGRGVRAMVAAFALAYGMPAPYVWIVDDPAPNALAFGRPASGHVCVTSGALGLDRDDLDALCMFEVTALASRAYAYATSAADLVLLGEWCTRLLWSAAAVVALSTVVGVPLDIAAGYFVSTLVVVAVTRPLLMVADRGLVSLIDDTSELVDLETIRQSARPELLACLLLDLLDDQRQARSRPEIAHLWFERDLMRRNDAKGLARLIGESAFTDLGISAFGARGTGRARRGLLERASAAVDFADGDAELRARLDASARYGR
jgi:hypothetical protein